VTKSAEGGGLDGWMDGWMDRPTDGWVNKQQTLPQQTTAHHCLFPISKCMSVLVSFKHDHDLSPNLDQEFILTQTIYIPAI